MKVNRKEFLKVSGAAAACACAGVSFNGCSMVTGVSNTPAAPERSFSLKAKRLIVDTAKIPELGTDGGSVKLKTGEGDAERKVIIVRSGNRYLAYEDRCTHGQRELEFAPADGKLCCVSFGQSEFDLDGNVLGGPAEGPLKKYRLILEGNLLNIDLA